MKMHPSPIKLAILLLLATRPISHAESPPAQAVQQLPGYAELIALPRQAVKGYGIAALNLLCAKGLPGAESLDLSRELAVLDRWAAIVKKAERRFLPSFHRNPARYEGSLSVFKAVSQGGQGLLGDHLPHSEERDWVRDAAGQPATHWSWWPEGPTWEDPVG